VNSLALRVHERVLPAVRLLLLQPAQRGTLVRRRILDLDLDLLALVVCAVELNLEGGTVGFVFLAEGKGKGGRGGRRGEGDGGDGEEGGVEDGFGLRRMSEGVSERERKEEEKETEDGRRCPP
jgi:hypothetical protein